MHQAFPPLEPVKEQCLRRRGQHESAFANRAAAYSLGIFTSWSDTKEDEQNIRWTRGFGDAIRPFSTGGGHVNYMTEDEGNNGSGPHTPEPTSA